MKSVKDILNNKVLTAKTAHPNLKPSTDYPNSYDKITCPICQDRGIVLEGDIAYPCSCMQSKKVENQFRYARISRELMNCRLDKFRFDYYSADKTEAHRDGAVKALKAARDFVNNCRRTPYGLGIMYTGPVGSGKTYLAASIANELIDSNLKVLFLVVPDLLDELRATYKTDLNELDLLDTARTIPILILDDLGAHNYTDWTRNRLYSIINYRLNEQLPTVITSNLSLDEMEDYIGLRTTSRIIQSSRIFRLTVQKDIRLQIYQEREGKI